MTCLVHLGSGVGNIVLASPLLVALGELGFTIDVMLDADYPQTAGLLRPWSLIREVFAGGDRQALEKGQYDVFIPAIPPFYWGRYRRTPRAGARVVPRPAEAHFARDEQGFYMSFARALGYPSDRRPACCLPIGAVPDETRVGLGTLVLAPGCKTGRMAAKRWPYYTQLADRFDDVAVVGTSDDLTQHDGRPLRFARHVRSYVDRLTLRETAELMAAAGVVVGNDAGLAHVAGAVGTRTIMLFGPTADGCLGPLPDNVAVVRAGLPCEPCWTSAPLEACAGAVSCLAALPVDRVEREVRASLVEHTRPTEVA